MPDAFAIHPWKVVQTAFRPVDQRFAESLMSLGNGAFGLRGNFEEHYTGDTHRGTYLGGVWFPDRTRVGWWKNGYPAYFGKVINAVNLIGLDVSVNDVRLDLAAMEILDFRRELDMEKGLLSRRVTMKMPEGRVWFETERFVSMADKHLLALTVRIRADYPARLRLSAFLDGDVHNEDSNHGEQFWEHLGASSRDNAAPGGTLLSRTRENPFGTPRFTVAASFRAVSSLPFLHSEHREGWVCAGFEALLPAGETAVLEKYACVATDRDFPADGLSGQAEGFAEQAARSGYAALREAHVSAWAKKWEAADVAIRGDEAAQQGIRFNLFHLLSTYTGEDARLNIGPKGFTGEKYGGATYWDTEAFCFPVYLATAGETVARQLLRYRFDQLPGAYLNAKRQGLPGALFPMVTFNGVECHNEWEITFMELHRNGAVAYAIFNYTRYTGDESYLFSEGLDVLLGIARFWAGRVHFNVRTGSYMLHGVTGPNEYENNVNNNWYTNRIAAWCLDFFLETFARAPAERRAGLGVEPLELAFMGEVSRNMYEPKDETLGIFVQHDTFLDKELRPAADIPAQERPLNQHWSWDRILRSCYIKQADVLQGLYFLGHLYDKETKRRNFEFYELMTVHESSLSPSVHAVLASEIGEREKAVEMYRRTARLDLDDINRDTRDGLHVTSMSGAWLAIVQGFAGMRTADGGLSFSPFLPGGWQGYAFRFLYRGRVLRFDMEGNTATLSLLSGSPLAVRLWDRPYQLENQISSSGEVA